VLILDEKYRLIAAGAVAAVAAQLVAIGSTVWAFSAGKDKDKEA